MPSPRALLPKILFGFFVLGYAALMLVHAQLGADIDGAFLRTLQVGKPLLAFSDNYPYSDQIDLGRWTPMVNMEYNLIGLFSNSPHPFWYYLYHALQVVVFVLLFVKLLQKAGGPSGGGSASGGKNRGLIYAVIALFFLIPASALGWFRLSFPERNVLFLFAAFLLAFLSFFEKRKMLPFFFILLTANLAIYYKEISFLALGVFALAHLLFTKKLRKESDTRGAILDILIMASAALYLLLYYLIVYTQSSLTYLPSTFTLMSRLKVFANYAFFSDSLLILVLLPLTLWRLFRIFVRKAAPEPLWDAALLGASAYVGAFFILNLYGPYYLLPAYALALPAVFHFLRTYTLRTLPCFFKITLGITALCLIFNAIPSGLYYLTFNKYYPVNFNKAADFLVENINARAERDPRDKPSVFIYGLGAESEGIQGVYFNVYDFLAHKKLDDWTYDMKSDAEITTDYSDFSKIDPPHAVFSPGPAYVPKSGDYLLLIPSKSLVPVSRETIEDLKKDYNLVFEINSPLAFPNVNVKTFIKRVLGRYAGAEGLVVNRNIGISPDFYVFRRSL